MFLLKFKKIKKHFKVFAKNNSGRNNSGSITVFSKGLRKNTNLIPLIHPIT
jgi:hypothetical protein